MYMHTYTETTQVSSILLIFLPSQRAEIHAQVKENTQYPPPCFFLGHVMLVDVNNQFPERGCP